MPDIKIENCSSEDVVILMARGHVPKTPFKAAARAHWGEPLRGFDDPSHEWWRATPDPTGEYRVRYHDAEPHSRGAFAVTVMVQW